MKHFFGPQILPQLRVLAAISYTSRDLTFVPPSVTVEGDLSTWTNVAQQSVFNPRMNYRMYQESSHAYPRSLFTPDKAENFYYFHTL